MAWEKILSSRCGAGKREDINSFHCGFAAGTEARKTEVRASLDRWDSSSSGAGFSSFLSAPVKVRSETSFSRPPDSSRRSCAAMRDAGSALSVDDFLDLLNT